MELSVIICTFNRANSLSRTLRSLAAQHGTDFEGVEVLIVDNSSNDHTKQVVDSFESSLPIRYVHEEKQGLAFARNTGVLEALGETLLFTDDDIRFHSRWLVAYRAAIRTFQNASFFGGRVVPEWHNSTKPPWLYDEQMSLLRGVVGAFDFGESTRPYAESDEGPVGASFAVRRSMFDTTGLFNTDLGVVGRSRGRGEETEFIKRMRENGAIGIYVGEALCWHAVQSEHLTLPSLFRHGIAKGRAHRDITGEPRKGSIRRALNLLLRGTYQLLKGRGDRFRQCIIQIGMELGRI